MEKNTKLRIGISTCLLGEPVRFDGGHKHDRYLTQTLGHYIEWRPVCPEVEMGLPVPRESIRLIRVSDNVRLNGSKSNTDYTNEMKAWSTDRLAQLEAENLCGYILKRSSPSCGIERVRIYDHNGMPQRNGVGIYARMLMEKFPLLPVEEEGRLNDPILLENFIERIFAYHRLQQLLQEDPTPNNLVVFHTRHKLALMAHNLVNYRQLGKLVAFAGSVEINALLMQYAELFMKTLRRKATPKQHANVLFHILGYFKKKLDVADKEECVQSIEDYRQGYVPLVVPLTLLKHHLRRHPVAWLMEQVYFNPYPAELMLRNKI